MRREVVQPRPDWQQRVEAVGFTYHSLGQPPSGDAGDGVYWYEGAAYRFDAEEVDRIEAATKELHRLCLAAVDEAVRSREEMARFGLSPAWMDLVQASWRRRDPYLMGRFDLAYEPRTGAVKMLEYNADTPTLAIETSLVQWFWKEERLPAADQFNSLHEKLLDGFRGIAARLPAGAVLHFAALESYPEELQHSTYFQDLAQQAGIATKWVPVAQIGWQTRGDGSGRFVDQDNLPIRFLHKLYPWEWLAQERFGPYLLQDRVAVVEPPWKMLLSNKALLPLLSRMFPGHPNVLPASWERADMRGDHVAKPVLAREGANIELVRHGHETIRTGGSYGGTPVVYQELAALPVFDGQHVVLGSWMVGEEPAGMVVRESASPVVVNTSRVVPHWFDPA